MGQTIVLIVCALIGLGGFAVLFGWSRIIERGVDFGALHRGRRNAEEMRSVAHIISLIVIQAP